VVLTGKATIEDISKELKPLFIRNGSTILKTSEVYLERDKNAVLVDSLAIEANRKTIFLAMISGRDDGVVVRLYPKVEVEKTDGVRTILAELVKQLLAAFPGLKVGETNLADYLR
jgi:hypothetical protein